MGHEQHERQAYGNIRWKAEKAVMVAAQRLSEAVNHLNEIEKTNPLPTKGTNSGYKKDENNG